MSKWFIIFWLLFHFVAQSQEQLEVVNIVGQPEGEKIAVTFTLGKGNFCQGALLLRTTDTTNLQTLESVGEITGVCGSQDFEASYTLFDNSPFLNQPTFYRLLLGDFPSDFIAVQLDRFGENGVRIYPNPATERVNFFLDNQKQQPWRVEVYHIQGGLVYESAPMRSNPIVWNLDPQLSGIYFSRIYLENKLVRIDRIVVQ